MLATGVSVALLLALILRAKMHAFPALILVSIFAAIAAGMTPDAALRTVTNGMGGSLGFIAVVVGLGAMFGVFLQSGGGVEAISTWLLDKMGIKAGRWAMGIVGLVVAIPVFFDVALIILAPIIFGLAKRAKTAPMAFGLPLLAGLATAHAFIPPTPGPIAVAELLGADLGWVILFGVIAGAPAMLIAGPLYTRFAEKRGWLEGSSEGMAEALGMTHLDKDVNPHAARTAISVILIPLVLILAGTIAKSTLAEGQVLTFISFVGHPFVALLIACGVAHLAFRPKDKAQKSVYREALSKALEPAGAVILITGAGGAFKQVLVDTGAGKALAEAAMSAGLAPIVAGFVLAVLVRVAQGSATVAMITAAGLTAPIVSASGLSPAQTGLVVIAIAAGASVVSHVNDSGFWLVSRYFGLTEAQTLRTWTVSVTLVGVVGFTVVCVLSLFI
ncbi:MAG: gluconate transporter [Robiginitomaculum sp.]|nr:MAG: gluconate transporter [Robiginitomaculum sp.]